MWQNDFLVTIYKVLWQTNAFLPPSKMDHQRGNWCHTQPQKEPCLGSPQPCMVQCGMLYMYYTLIDRVCSLYVNILVLYGTVSLYGTLSLYGMVLCPVLVWYGMVQGA